jgi:hypothetical protein
LRISRLKSARFRAEFKSVGSPMSYLAMYGFSSL